MSAKQVAGSLVLAWGMFVGTGTVLAGDEAAKQDPGDAAAMEAMAKAAAPGEFHAHLNAMVGRWSLKVQWRMDPNAEWAESKSTAESKWVLGGRFVREEVEGEFMEGMRFQGFGMTGYDNLKKKYTSMWTDNMSTGMMISEGTCDASGKVFTYRGRSMDPMTGTEKTYKWTIRIVNNDKYISEMYTVGEDGKEFKSMEITYTRS